MNSGIAVVGLAIGEGELGGLDNGVDVVGGVVAHRGEVEAFEQLELLQEDGALRPGSALEDGHAAVVRARGRLDARGEALEVGGAEQAAVGVGPRDDFARDVAAVEALARGVEAGLAPTIFRRRFGVEHALEKICERGVLQHAARLRDFAVGQINARRRRPLGQEAFRVAGERAARPGHRVVGANRLAGQSDVHREAVVGELQRGLKNVGERPGAELSQRRHERVKGRRNARGEQPDAGNQLEPKRAEMGDCGARGRHHIAVDRDDAAGSCRINQHWRFAADGVHVRVHDALDECCSDGGVDGISATCEDSRTGCTGKIVLRRNHRAAAHYEGVNRRHLSSFFPRR